MRRLLSRVHLLVQSSVMEGGANAVAEALAAGVPVIASRIAGNVGMLGENYPGYCPVGARKPWPCCWNKPRLTPRSVSC